MRKTTMLRELLKGNEIVVAPLAYDGISAKAAEFVGFRAAAIGGFALEATLLGEPDVGMLSCTEILEHVSKMADAVNIPLILDGETGFGGPLQVARTIKLAEKTGVAAIHIEDQIQPKKCGSLLTKRVIPREEAVAKIKAAVDARTDPDFVIIARTDADVVSYEEVVERLNLYLEAGADMAMPIHAGFRKEGPVKLAEVLRQLPKDIKGPTVVVRIDLAGMTAQDAQEAGYKITCYPVFNLFAATQAIIDSLKELKEKGIPSGRLEGHPVLGYAEFMEFIGYPKIQEMERKYVY